MTSIEQVAAAAVQQITNGRPVSTIRWAGVRVAAIRCVRDATGCALGDARDAVDLAMPHPGTHPRTAATNR